MLESIIVLLISLISVSVTFPGLVKNKQYNVIVVASLLLLTGIITMVLHSFDIINLDPAKGLTKIFKPISQLIINLIQP